MSVLHQWAIKWGIGLPALHDLQTMLGMFTLPEVDAGPGKSEAWAQSAIRIEASQKGVTLWRNNVGALFPKDSKRLVRFGLANDSDKLNEQLKSSDLFGWRTVVVQPHMVGYRIAQVVGREVKEPGWSYAATPREVAQLNWINLVNAAGGDARFATGPGTL
jgi:hypothetical protein